MRDLELAKSEELRASKMEMKGHRKEKVLKDRRGRKRRGRRRRKGYGHNYK